MADTQTAELLSTVEVRASALTIGQRLVVETGQGTTVLRVSAIWVIAGEWCDELKVRCDRFPYPLLIEARSIVRVVSDPVAG